MTESFIKKIQPDQNGHDFEGLRKEGIRILQEVSGDVWTDFNLHDPGVTLLEAICYALTDLLYRAGVSAADCLTSSDGTIDYKQQALYRADEILPCCPVTENDYRKLILNAVPNIDNVWVKSYSGATEGLLGLFQIYVQLNEKVQNQNNPGVRKAYSDVVAKTYAANRNLCEDLHGVEIVERLPYFLRGEIELEGKREPANILAQIYFECEQYLNPKVPVHSYEKMYNSGSSLEQLFSGVLTGYGYIADDELHPWRGHFSIADLIGKISQIKGVKDVKSLFFVDGSGDQSDRINLGEDCSYLAVACLRFPPPPGEVGISLYKAGKAYPVALHDVETEFERLEYIRQTMLRGKAGGAWLDGILPTSTFRNIQEYYSIQNNFPDVYGLNAYGIPDSAPQTRKAQATQLKAYLLIFEQIKANFLQNLQQVPRLFSVEEALTQSYFYQVLNNDTVPNVEKIYRDGVAGMDSKLTQLLAGFDDFGDRRNRVLDYLLGIYGEKFSQNSLRQFFSEDSNTEEKQIRNKIAFLKEIVDISKNRATAFNYRKPSQANKNHSGLKKKLQMLLGAIADKSEFSAQMDDGMQIVEHILLRPSAQPSHEGDEPPNDFYSFRASVIFSSTAMGMDSKGLRKLAVETMNLNCPAHVYPEMFWLEAEPMNRFNRLHKAWLQAKQLSADPSPTTDAAAAQLIIFLLEIRENKNE